GDRGRHAGAAGACDQHVAFVGVGFVAYHAIFLGSWPSWAAGGRRLVIVGLIVVSGRGTVNHPAVRGPSGPPSTAPHSPPSVKPSRISPCWISLQITPMTPRHRERLSLRRTTGRCSTPIPMP